MTAQEPSYWRLTALETFDGTSFGPSGSYRKAGRSLPEGTPVDAPARRLDQHVHISGLASDWLPVAYRPFTLRGVKRAAFDDETSSLLAATQTVPGVDYDVSSSLATLDGSRLAVSVALDTPPAKSQLERDLRLPSVFPRAVSALARDLTAQSATPFEKARALQDYFRTNFTYDLAVPAPQQPKNLADFVLNGKRGYCEQFSTSFAAMARSIGIPARVAVGFTPGELVDGVFRVSGRDAHAWPEVYLDRFGWVAFEPTPGRAIPAGEAYTGVHYDPTAGLPSSPTTTIAGVATTTPAVTAATVPNRAPATVEPAARGRTPFYPNRTWAVAAIAFVLLAIGPLGRRFGRRRRRRRIRQLDLDAAGTADIELAWAQITDELSWLGMTAGIDETSTAFASRANDVLGSSSRSGVVALADRVEVVRWAPATGTSEIDAESVSAAVRVDVQKQLSDGARILRWFDPRLARRPPRRPPPPPPGPT